MFKTINKENFTKENIISVVMLAFLFLYMYALNFLMPLHRDDYEYSLIWGTYQKIMSLPDICQSLYIHYFTHGGRMVDFFVLDSFLLLGKQWFNPFNAFLYVMLIVLIYWHSQQKITWRFNPYILALIISFCWLGLPDFALVNIWMCGACVYLLTAVLIFSFLLPYHFSFLGKPLIHDSYLSAAMMFCGGIVAGWTIENTAATMNLIIISFIYYAYKKHSLTKWMISGFCGSVIGYLLLVIAPGNYVRYANQNTKFIYHLLNQLGAGIELLLGLLPVVIFIVLAWRILLTEHAKTKGIQIIEAPNGRLAASSILRVAIMLLMVTSYINNYFFSEWISNIIYDNLIVRLGFADSQLKTQLFKTMSGLEEVITYLLFITQMYRYIFKKWALRESDMKNIIYRFKWQEIMQAYPRCYHIAVLIVLSVINNLVMLASPTFPGRAGFGSAVFLIISAMSFFKIDKVNEYLLANFRKKYLAIFAGVVFLPMAIAALNQHIVLYRENNQRIAYVEEMVNQGMTELEVKPISIKNLVLRHVYFVDLNNQVSKYGFCRYYGLKDIKVKD